MVNLDSLHEADDDAVVFYRDLFVALPGNRDVEPDAVLYQDGGDLRDAYVLDDRVALTNLRKITDADGPGLRVQRHLRKPVRKKLELL